MGKSINAVILYFALLNSPMDTTLYNFPVVSKYIPAMDNSSTLCL